MSGRWEPGTVATILVDGNETTGLATGDGWLYADSAGAGHLTFDQVEVAHPLVVLDPENLYGGSHVRGLAGLLRDFLPGGDDAPTKETYLLREVIRDIEAQTRPPKPETVSAHDSCRDEGWTEVDGLLYCNNCGFSEVSRFIKGGGAA